MLAAPGGMRNEPSTTLPWLSDEISAQLKVQTCVGAVGSTWLHISCAPPIIAAPPQLTGDAADAGPGEPAISDIVAKARRHAGTVCLRHRCTCRHPSTALSMAAVISMLINNRRYGFGQQAHPWFPAARCRALPAQALRAASP